MNDAFTPAVGRLAPIRAWRIHLGAHTTAAHLQDTLEAIRPALLPRGVDFAPHEPLRDSYLALILRRRRRLLGRVPILGPARMREAIEATVAPLRAGPETMVLSEENILGVARQIIGKAFYPRAAASVAQLASLAPRAELAIFLSVRSYDTLLPSAYVEALKNAPQAPGGFGAAKARLAADPPSWFELVERIRTAAPEVPLRIWRHEDYRANLPAIVEALCGCPIETLPQIADPTRARSPSAVAIAAAEALPRDLAPEERARRVRLLFEESDPRADRFQPFTPAEQQRLRADYEADLDRIAQAYPDVLMRFAPRARAA